MLPPRSCTTEDVRLLKNYRPTPEHDLKNRSGRKFGTAWIPNKSQDCYYIDKILDEEVQVIPETNERRRLFKVKWVGYPESEATWEPCYNLTLTDALRDWFKKRDNKWIKEHELEYAMYVSTAKRPVFGAGGVRLEDVPVDVDTYDRQYDSRETLHLIE